MHKLAAEIELAITIPFVHIADTTAAAVRGDGLDTRRPARHGVHDGAGLLRRPAAPSTGSTVIVPGRGRPPDRARRDLRRAVPSASSATPRASEYRRIMRVAGRAGRPGDPARLHRDRPAGRPRGLAGPGVRHDPAARRAGGRAQRGVRRVAAAFQVAVTATPGARPSSRTAATAHLGHQRLPRQQSDPRAAADLGDRDDLGGQVVLRGARRARRPRARSPTGRGSPPTGPVGGVGADDRPAAVERDRRQPVARRRARPVSTTAPVKSATNADAGRAESSAAGRAGRPRRRRARRRGRRAAPPRRSRG